MAGDPRDREQWVLLPERNSQSRRGAQKAAEKGGLGDHGGMMEI